MKVHELITALQQHDPEALVIIARDEEGNGFSELTVPGVGLYLRGEVYNEDDGDDVPEGAVKAVVLWP